MLYFFAWDGPTQFLVQFPHVRKILQFRFFSPIPGNNNMSRNYSNSVAIYATVYDRPKTLNYLMEGTDYFTELGQL
jgi:hypothetical protein